MCVCAECLLQYIWSDNRFQAVKRQIYQTKNTSNHCLTFSTYFPLIFLFDLCCRCDCCRLNAGLHCAHIQDERRIEEHNVTVVVEFATALMSVLDQINRESFQRFRLRIGLNHGPVIAGVIGAQKPQYDIWSNTVNVASRMDSCGIMGRMQVNLIAFFFGSPSTDKI